MLTLKKISNVKYMIMVNNEYYQHEWWWITVNNVNDHIHDEVSWILDMF